MLVTLRYKMDFPNAGYTCAGSVDSDGIVKSTLEARLVPGSLTLTLSAELNHGGAGVVAKGGRQKKEHPNRFGMALSLVY